MFQKKKTKLTAAFGDWQKSARMHEFVSKSRSEKFRNNNLVTCLASLVITVWHDSRSRWLPSVDYFKYLKKQTFHKRSLRQPRISRYVLQVRRSTQHSVWFRLSLPKSLVSPNRLQDYFVTKVVEASQDITELYNNNFIHRNSGYLITFEGLRTNHCSL